MQRLYQALVNEHFAENRQMLFLAGPRQVGKTTIALSTESFNLPMCYLNWDDQATREMIISGQVAVAEHCGLQQLSDNKMIVIFDEIHKYYGWKNFLKGFFDGFEKVAHIMVTGSSRLDTYRVGGDSLMGRYFPYRVHPLSLAECIRTSLPKKEISKPQAHDEDIIERLLTFGGFPEPYMKGSERFNQRWQMLRYDQLLREDIRDMTRIRDLDQLEILAKMLNRQVGQLLNYSNLAKHIQVSSETIKSWLKTLQGFYYCFLIQPWHTNVSRSLLKQPKCYMWDWSTVEDQGARYENFIASHLLKVIQFWQDYGLGRYELYYIRDKEKREVDFVVCKDNEPYILIESKVSRSQSLSQSLQYFKQVLNVPYAFQVVYDLPYVDEDCFSVDKPTIVPARTLLSQFV